MFHNSQHWFHLLFEKSFGSLPISFQQICCFKYQNKFLCSSENEFWFTIKYIQFLGKNGYNIFS